MVYRSKNISRRLFVQSITMSKKYIRAKNFLEPIRINRTINITRKVKKPTKEKITTNKHYKQPNQPSTPAWAKLSISSSKPN